MARYRTRRYRSAKSKRRSKSMSSNLERFAYKMGQVNRGLKNPDSRITASFTRGSTVVERPKRKSLF